ncbi:zinc finger protein 596-like [Stegodyphus dumicola]|uniref:zinc finger protein 596-like n=1 Tax=Stegodyphus dumicola TaxID=202533 RepID=UPI0015AEB636|nr:zinc finger protein 596-like [Stegodyphus dumicola]
MQVGAKGKTNLFGFIYCGQFGVIALFSCAQCRKTFTSTSMLKKHEKTHQKEGMKLRHKCTLCPYSTNTITHLKRHFLIHSGERPFSCVICGKAFTTKWNMEQHIRTHTGEKPYACGICWVRFADRSDCSRHQSVHYDLRPYACGYCGLTFKHTKSLRRHENHHLKEQSNTSITFANLPSVDTESDQKVRSVTTPPLVTFESTVL